MTADHVQFVGFVPDYYDLHMGPMIFADFAVDLARRAAEQKPQTVLETACGTGIVTRQLRLALPSGVSIIATDLNPPMIDVARTKFQSYDAVAFQPADAQELPFEDASFDAVVCQFGVMFYPDKDRSYREVHRVLKPGGRYLFNVWDSHRYNPFARIGHDIILKLFPVDPPLFMTIPFSYAFEPIKHSLLAAGFGDIACSVVRFAKSLENPAHFAEGFVFGSPVADQIRARGGLDPDEVLKQVSRAFEGEFGGKQNAFELQALVFSAMKSH